jgi:hypothetical protein
MDQTEYRAKMAQTSDCLIGKSVSACFSVSTLTEGKVKILEHGTTTEYVGELHPRIGSHVRSLNLTKRQKGWPGSFPKFTYTPCVMIRN